MKLSSFNPLLVGLACAAGSLMVSATAQAETLRLSTPVPPSHIFSKVSGRLAENLGERSDGRYAIEVSPYGRLGNDNELIQLLQHGAVQLGVVPAASLSSREPSFNGWFLPGEFENYDEAGAATQLPAARSMLEKLEPQGMIGLGYIIAGMRHVLSTDSVESIDDFTNQKIRVFPNPVFNDWWLANGAAPTALPTSEVAPALTTNLLNAVDVDLDFVTALKLYQQAPHLALTNHMAFPGVVLVSKAWWDRQSEADQKMIREVFQEAEQWGIEEQARVEKENLATLKDAGVEVVEINTAGYAETAAAVRQTYIDSDPLIAEFYHQVVANQ
ncbi:TRAP transporter substrate-binding protein [Vreelandella titanicae]|jgi:TRAP-type C4-dicarboxylate transport system substrate-binding protein|uniref:Extracellular solute-binding protein, family 7, bacteria n=1 Tax=Vreelandella titanicae BH1 TaxID=1204738 RepID=L9UCV0_9GAMM|nr:TRAP transporter substrate-binding protein [Halomonas titanicae]ELY22810.1 Extracellular solute-binding protein, family 7, bacteria [Halomonas titanicae BH1]MCE7517804.1 TRAP transporter substrate-binding protein [Halomonas titanicae]NVE89150.1 TRAP transporter substrate-binding protein [Halomonas titanicae]|tara:strand:+ start:590 stop:1576 length:987 start_codon:yes stop_codon:yes gene_type:complete